MEQFYDYIIKEHSAGTSRMEVYRGVKGKGYKDGQSAAYDYMNKIVKRLHLGIAIYKSSKPEAIQKKKVLEKYDHLTRNEIVRFLWLDAELAEMDILMPQIIQHLLIKPLNCVILSYISFAVYIIFEIDPISRYMVTSYNN